MPVERGVTLAPSGTAIAAVVFTCLVASAGAQVDSPTAPPETPRGGSPPAGELGVEPDSPAPGVALPPDSTALEPSERGDSLDLDAWSPPDSSALRTRFSPFRQTTPALPAGPDTLAAREVSADSSAARPPPLVWRPVGVRIVQATAAFVRPWSSLSTGRPRGLRRLSAQAPEEAPAGLPFERATRVDLARGWIVMETRMGDSFSIMSYVARLDEFHAGVASRMVGSQLLSAVRANLGREGAEGAGGLLDFDIPMPLPGPFVRAIGPGANLKVRGSERITFGGQSSYYVDELARESAPPSRFPQLNMEQQLTVNLEGTIGRKIHVYVDHRSGGDAFGAGKANQVRVHYDGDEDEIIQKIELGEVNLSLPGTEFVSYSGHHEGLFGAKMTSKIGKLDLTTIASKEEGKTANANFTGTSESDSLVIKDVSYKRRTFFAVDSDVLRYGNVSLEELQIYLDDRNGGNDVETGASPGVAYLTGEVAYGDQPGHSVPRQRGMFDQLVELEDYLLDYQSGIVEFLSPIPAGHVVAVSYSIYGGETVGWSDADSLRIKMIKKDGLAEAEWEPVRFYELKNFYDLGAKNIPEEGFDLKVRKRSPSGEILDTYQGVPLIEILGLDRENLAGEPVPDGIVDSDRSRVDLEKGLLIFPHFTPFCPAFDAPTNFYYTRGDTASYYGFASELRPDGVNCAVYEKEVIQPEDDVYFIEVKYDRPRTTFYLGQLNIIENSEVVRLNGIRLSRGIDYTIYYPAGQLTLLSEEAKEPEARVTVEYDYKPFGIGGEKTLLGTRGVYNWSENVRLGTTWMYQSRGTPEDRPRLGEEPSRNVVGDINLAADFEPDFMTSLADLIPFVDTDAPSRLKVAAEAAVSIPEPNTKGFVSIDDMEGAEDVSSLGVSRPLWVPSSVPVASPTTPAVVDSERMDIDWYNPDQKVDRGDIYPVLHELNPQEADDNQIVLEIDFQEGGEYSWAGLMRVLSKTGADYSDAEFLEFWVHAGSDPQGSVHIDLGTISEDFYPLRAPNGGLPDTEDVDDDGFDNSDAKNDDTGLDNVLGDDDLWYPESPDDGDDDYWYERGSGNYSRINGTEGNEKLDTEDLNDNGYLDTENRYWELKVDLRDTTYLAEDNSTFGSDSNPDDVALRNPWRLYRIPLDHALPVGGITGWSAIKSARIWFEHPVPGSPEPPSVMVASLDIVGSQWEATAIRDTSGAIVDSLAVGESFGVSTKNTREDDDYTPPFSPEVEEDTGAREREQSLALLYLNLQSGHEASARKVLYAADDYTSYRSLEFYLHGESGVEDGTVFFIRLGADTLNYYEYSLEVRRGWNQDPSSEDNQISVPFTSLTNLKLDPFTEADEAVVVNESGPVAGETFRRVGWPSLSRVSRLTVGVRNAGSGARASQISGEIWIDDISLGDVRKDIGWAERMTIEADFADLMKVNFDMRHVDGEFHTLKQTRGSGQDNLTYNVTSTVNADRFVSDLGIAVPVNVTWKRSTTRPKFSAGSDIVLGEEQSDDERTEVLDRSLAASFSRKKHSDNFWPHLLLDGISLRGSISDHKRLAPTKADTSRTMRGRLSYRYSPEKQGIRVFRNMHIYLKPTSLRFSTDAQVSHARNFDIASGGDKTLRTDNWDKKLNGEANIDFQFLDNLKTTHSVSFRRDLGTPNRRWLDLNVGIETERRYANTLSFNPKFGTWFAPQYNFSSSYTDNHGPGVRRTGDPPGIRDIRAQDNQEVRASFDFKKLVGTEARRPPSRPKAREGDREGASEEEGDQEGKEEGEAEGQEGEPPGLGVLIDPVLNLFRRMDAIEGRYRLKRTSRYDRVTEDELPGLAYTLGLTSGAGSDDRTQEHTVTLGTGVKLTNQIRVKSDFKRTTSGRWYKNALSDTVKLTSRTESMNQSLDGSLSWSGLEKVGLLEGLCSSVRARSGVGFKRSYSGPYDAPSTRGTGLSLSPIVSLDATFKNGLTGSFSWDRKRSRSRSLTGVGSVTEDLSGTKSVSMNYRFSAPQGLKLPFFGQKLKFQSNLDLSVTWRSSSKETRTASDEEILPQIDPTSWTRDSSLTADATYSFSRNVSGGLQVSWAQNQDVKRDRTRRTIGVHVTAEFKF